MHILLTNDDGCQAPGIAALAKAFLAAGHKVTIAAPDRERSASSHGLSIHEPLRTKDVCIGGARGWAIDGTPVDCARLGLYLTRDERPDLVISGINRGPNLGGACIYSGTVNAAMEASMAGVPAMAVSLNSFVSDDYSLAAELALMLAPAAANTHLKRGELFNLNVPAIPKINGLIFTQVLGPEFLTDARYEEFTSDYKVKYYFLDDGENRQLFPDDCDVSLVNAGWATLSVLTWDIAEGVKDAPYTQGQIIFRGESK